MTLKWNEIEHGWVCSDCGAIYGDEEVQRLFGFDDQIPENFCEGYCMDCGVQFTEAVK